MVERKVFFEGSFGKICGVLHLVENSKEKQSKTTEYTEELFNALMQKAFRGELV